MLMAIKCHLDEHKSDTPTKKGYLKELKSRNTSLSTLARQENSQISKSTVRRVVKEFGNLVYWRKENRIWTNKSD